MLGHATQLADALFHCLPSGGGVTGIREVTLDEIHTIMVHGATWAIEQGYGFPEGLAATEEHGCLAGAAPDAVSEMATQRGIKQLGSIGSGNHFCEVEVVDHLYDSGAAEIFHQYCQLICRSANHC